MKLGKFLEISVGVIDIGQSLPFFERLGFEKLDQNWEPWPWAILTDGTITLNLSQQSGPSNPVLNYFSSDMKQRVEELKSAGLDVVAVQDREIPEVVGGLEMPGGIEISLVEYSARRIPKLAGRPFSKCGSFGELAFPVEDLGHSVACLEKVGFTKLRGDRLPYPWAAVSDGLVTLGLYQSEDLEMPALVYHCENLSERLDALRQEGFETLQEMPSLAFGVGRFALVPPSARLLLIMEYRPSSD
ncbi:MAG TPA: hypothetical protein VMY18_02290 [Acidobacteriota bacterium]|nr:hypothetical protein [Acidobacteriota bacterium]